MYNIIITIASLVLDILSATLLFFYVPKTHRWFPLFDKSGRLVLADAWLLTEFIQLFSAAMSRVVPFFPFQNVFLRFHKSSATKSFHNFCIFYIRSLAVARLDWWLTLQALLNVTMAHVGIRENGVLCAKLPLRFSRETIKPSILQLSRHSARDASNIKTMHSRKWSKSTWCTQHETARITGQAEPEETGWVKQP
jgi:hypothetical protein